MAKQVSGSVTRTRNASRNTAQARKALQAAAKDIGGTAVVIRSRLGRKPPPPNESRRERFQRIGERRMNEVIKKIELLGNLSGSQYECQGEDIEVMRNSIIRSLDAALSRFAPRTRERLNTFRFEQRGVTH